LLKELGLFDSDPLVIENKAVVPLDFLKALLEKKLGLFSNLDKKDIVVFILDVQARRGEKKSRLKINWMDYYEEKTGFTAMERTTGFSAAIVAIMQAKGEVPKGALPPERAVNPESFLEELKKRGFNITIEK
jgi:lysine 6-dehydrogenase